MIERGKVSKKACGCFSDGLAFIIDVTIKHGVPGVNGLIR